MIVASFNGWNVVQPPTSPAAKQIDWEIDDNIGELENPFSFSAQQQDWMSDRWAAQLSLPPMPQAQWSAWRAFLMEMRGKLNVFPWGDPLGCTPAGECDIAPANAPVMPAIYGNFKLPDANGQPQPPQITTVVADGAQNQRARVLKVRGFVAGVQNQLLLGDYFQIGWRLHNVIATNVDSDASGKAQIAIWPCLRENVNDGDPLIFTNPVGLFRLQQNKRNWSVGISKFSALSLSIKEALALPPPAGTPTSPIIYNPQP